MKYRKHCRQWEEIKPLYDRFCSASARVIARVLEAENYTPLLHQISYRTKAPDKFLEKCERKGYTDPLRQMKDLAGIRIITLFESDVSKIVEVINKNFVRDYEHSKIKAPKSSRILSYRSIHLVTKLSDQLSSKPDFEEFKDLTMEIQVRSVLQHAWAEIDHDSRYKSNFELPHELERRLYLIAGLLEVADREFNDFRDKRNALIEDAKREITEKQFTAEPISNVFVEASLELVINKYHLSQKYIKENVSRLLALCKMYSIETVGQYVEVLDDIEGVYEFARISKSCLEKNINQYSHELTPGFVIFSGIILKKGLYPWSKTMPDEWVDSMAEAIHIYKSKKTREPL
jgi:ppGpp synthetase/RelA/SpoT-type nucleotidyltranferase